MEKVKEKTGGEEKGKQKDTSSEYTAIIYINVIATKQPV